MSRADELTTRLQAFCTTKLGRDVTISELNRFSGGASRETWSFVVDGRRLVVRLDPPSAPATTDRRAEVELLRRAHNTGVPVPEVVWMVAPDDLGSQGFVMSHIDGETIPRKILRDDEYTDARSRFASDTGRIAAKIHAMPIDGIPGIEAPERKPTEVILEQYASLLDSLGEPHPTFELALRWLATRQPTSERLTIVHGDYRNGNFIVGPEGVRAVLDWELVHIGDPWEDLAWLCTRSWRFGGAEEVGGVGSRDELYAAYEETSGMAVDRDAVHWWEVMSSVKWGVMTIVQAFTHLWGHVHSLELAAIGRRTVETEYDVLNLIGQN